MTRSLAALLWSVVSASLALAQEPASLERHAADIHDTYRAWLAVTNAKDIHGWATFLAPNPLFLPPDHPALRGTQAVLAYYTTAFGDEHFALDCHQERVEVAVSEDMAWSSGRCVATFSGPDGNPAQASSKWAKVWVRMEDGAWKCVVNSWSMTGG